ncbi:BTAD domain-containing putative transcriptional regulator, partial [Streptosporangium sp. NPDC000396]|uniref:AfsR/SARP family transcriptional regulator n=1 Tax=Streptosporangium sp. NPDC000396 TaxID=3366185 RepID=UPI00369967CD
MGTDLIALNGKQRSLLAMLLLNANRVVAVHHLADMVWGQPQPAAPESRVRMLVSGLRKALVGVGRDVIVTRPPGYLIHVEPDQLDLDVFIRKVHQAREAKTGGRVELAVACYDEALALWRGGALGGVSGPSGEAEAARLEELRLRVLEDRSEAMLSLDKHAELIADLGRLTAVHPLRERLHAHLMVALHRDGRRAEALDVYRSLRERLIEELGLEPTPELRQVQHRILAGDPNLEDPPPGSTGAARLPPLMPMRQLPADPVQFVGRAGELERLDGLLTAAGRQPTAVMVAVLSGT